ncbi:MAG: hypothetical protein AAF804_09040, partial [Bacteroidota bacterium]
MLTTRFYILLVALIMTFAGQAQVTSQDLILHLRFDGGLLADASGFNHQLVNHGTSFGEGVQAEGVKL